MRRVDYRNAALHETFERRVTKPAAQRKNPIDPFFLQGSGQQLTTANLHLTSAPMM
jgi:hypothetical protein